MPSTKGLHSPNTTSLRLLGGWLPPLILAMGMVFAGTFLAPGAKAQNYLTASGKPSFATVEPVELGFVDAANGNLHLRFDFGAFPQRGVHGIANIGLVYDSSLAWFVACGSTGCAWAPNATDTEYEGFRFAYPTMTNGGGNFYCSNGQQCGYYIQEMDGTKHYFFLTPSTFACTNPGYTYTTAYAADSSGIALVNSCVNNGGQVANSIAIYAPDGAFAPGGNFSAIEDNNGNIMQLPMSTYTSVTQVDTVGRTLYSNTYCAQAYYGCYDVPNSQFTNSGGTSRYIITGETTIPVNTNFGQSGVAECNTANGCGPFVVRTGLTLPDGSTYTFKYDCDSSTGNSACGSPAGQSAYYGMLISMTLPTGATIQYGYTTYADAYGNKWRWLNSRTSGGGTWTYSPALVNSFFCAVTQTNCQQKVTVTAPDSSKKIYTYTINNGAWPTTEQFYDTSGSVLSTINNTFDFSQNCQYSGCNGASNVRLLTTQTSVPGPGTTITNQTKNTYDSPQLGDVTGVQQWGFQPGASPSFSSTPDRATYTSWNIISNSSGNPNIHRPQSVTRCNNSGSNSACTGGGSAVAQTTYSYDSYGSNCPSGGLAPVSVYGNYHDSNYTASNTVRGNVTSTQNFVTSSTSVTTQLCYDITGQVTEVVDPNGNATLFAYADNFYSDASPAQNPPSAYSTGSSYSTNAYPTSITLPIIGALKVGYYFGSGKAAFTVDQNGADTYSHYLDALDRLTNTYAPITNGNRAWTLATYSPSETQIDAYSAVTTTSPSTSCTSCAHNTANLDSLGRPIQSTLANDPDGPTYTVTAYDSSGRTHSVTNPYRTTSDSSYGATTLSYDGLGRPTLVTDPDSSKVYLYYGASVTSGGGLSAQLCSPATYGNGYPLLQIDEAGNKKQTWANAFGETIEVDEPSYSSSALSAGTCYAHDVLGNLTSVVQTGGTTDSTQWRTRTFAYDGLSRLLRATEPESGTTTYTYDNNGNVLTKTSPAPNQTGMSTVTITYQYDALNRLTNKSYSDGVTQPVTFVYDGASTTACTLPTLTVTNGMGRQTGMCDGSGSEAWAYDTAGRITADARTTTSYIGTPIRRTLTTPITKSTNYTYNLDGSIASITYPSGRVVTYTPSAVGRPVSAVDTASNNYATNAHYSPGGDLGSIQNASNIVSTYIFNNRFQPCWLYTTTSTPLAQNSTCASTATAGNILDLKLNLNLGSGDNGNVIGITNNRDNTRSQNFAYDALNRLYTAQTASTYSTSPSNCWAETYTYDAWGNLYQFGPNSTTQSAYVSCSQESGLSTQANVNNQLLAYTYDAAGNLTNNGTAATYTPEGQLYIFGPSATSHTFYSYDGDGRRVAKTATNLVCVCREGAAAIGGGGGGCGTGCTGYFLDSTEKVYFYGSGGQPLTETDGNGNVLDDYISFAGARIARVDSSNNVVYYFADHLGSAREVVNSSGTILDDSDFYPFGGQRPVTSSSGNTYKFTGYERDTESGLDYASARHYSSTLGRFMSPDPLSGSPGNPQSWNRYSYVQNNPLNATDSSGMCDDDDPSDCDDSGDSGDSGNSGNSGATFSPNCPVFACVDLGMGVAQNQDGGLYSFSYGGWTFGVSWNDYTSSALPFYDNDGSYMSQIMNNAALRADWNAKMNLASGMVQTGAEYTAMQGLSVFGAAIPTLGKALYYLNLASAAPAANYSGYFGYDSAGNVRYVGRTGRDPAVRWGEHENAIGTGREDLNYRVPEGATGMTAEQSRIWEQRMINKYGLQKSGGLLLNQRNEIAPKFWKQLGILEELELLEF